MRIFDVLITCAFNYDAHSSEFDKLGRIQVLKARMNADLHMAEDLKNTGKGNLFVIFGEPDIDILERIANLYSIAIHQKKNAQKPLNNQRMRQTPPIYPKANFIQYVPRNQDAHEQCSRVYPTA